MTARTPMLLAFVVSMAFAPNAEAWNPFSTKRAAPKATDPTLTDESGPWLIVATTFSGEGAERQAHELAAELRETLGEPTYVHPMRFDFKQDGERLGRGVDKYGEPVRMKYSGGEARREWAVLVGDFPAIDDPIAERRLAEIKQLRPASLAVDGSTQNYAEIRQRQRAVLTQRGRGRTDGPMRTAFLSRNPVLPEEFFVPKGVDEFVAKLNKGIDHSLLKADGRYSIKVATFRGRGKLLGATARRARKKGARKQDDPLLEAGWNAHLLCEAMRDAGWEAYEFHDRQQSYVSVGSFDTIDEGGRPTPEVLKIVRTFGAAYNTPATPLDKRLGGARPKINPDAVRQSFDQLFTAQRSQLDGVMKPKYAHVRVDKDRPMKPVPFDIEPEAVEVPRRSLSSRFAWRR